MSEDIRFSIILPVFHGDDFLKRAVESICTMDFQPACFEVLVVSTERDEGSRGIVESLSPGSPFDLTYVTVTRKSRPLMLNTAIDRSRGGILVFADDDCIFTPDYLMKLQGVMSRESEIGVIGGNDIPTGHDSDFNLALDYVFNSFAGTGGLRRDTGPRCGKYYPKLWNMAIPREVACHAALNRHEEPPLIFNTSLTVHEDVDLVDRIAKSGKRIIYAPEVLIKHSRDTNLRYFIRRNFRMAQTSRRIGIHTAPHLALTVFVLGMCALGVLSAAHHSLRNVFFVVAGIYLTILLINAVDGLKRTRRFAVFPYIPLLLMSLHFARGLGYLLPGGSDTCCPAGKREGERVMSWHAWASQLRAVAGIMHGSRAFGGPFQALFSLTNKCNLRCVHCIFHSPFLERPNLVQLRRARQMSLDLPGVDYLKQLQKVEADTERTGAAIDELIVMGTRRFQFSGNGEPFLHANALDFMSRAKHSGSTCVVNTNGTLLHPSTVDELIRMGFDELQITTMAGTPEAYQRTHPASRETEFDTMKENFLYLADKKAAAGVSRPRISMCFVVVRHNHDNLLDFARFAGEVRADQVLFRAFFDVNDGSLSGLIPTAEEAVAIREQMTAVRDYLDTRKIRHNIGNFLNVFWKKLSTKALYRIIPCYYGWLSTVINAEGTVYYCCRSHEPLGNVKEMNFRDIWYGNKYSMIRKEAAELNMRKTPVSNCNCNQCANWNANLRSYKILHPLRGRSEKLRQVSPSFSEPAH